MKYIIEVIRRRSSVTQSMAHVLVNGVEMASFNDEIKLLKKDEHYYGGNIGGWASITPDESLIKGMFFHPFDENYHISEKFRKQQKVYLTDGSSLSNTSETARRCCGMYCGRMRTDRNFQCFRRGTRGATVSFFLSEFFYIFRPGYRSIVPRVCQFHSENHY